MIQPNPIDGYPFWPNTSPQHPGTIPGGFLLTELQDLAVNQVPHGSSLQISAVQFVLPQQAQGQGTGIDPSQNIGQTGPNLYDLFMASTQPPKDQTP